MKKALILWALAFFMLFGCGSSLSPLEEPDTGVRITARLTDDVIVDDAAQDSNIQDTADRIEPVDEAVGVNTPDASEPDVLDIADAFPDSQPDSQADARPDVVSLPDSTPDVVVDACASLPRPAISFNLSTELNRTLFSAGTSAMNIDSVSGTFPEHSLTSLNNRPGSSYFGRSVYQGYRSNASVGDRFGHTWTASVWIAPTCTNDFCSVFSIRTQESGFGLMTTNGMVSPPLYFYAKTASGWVTINYTERLTAPTLVTVTSSPTTYRLYVNGVLYQDATRIDAVQPEATAHFHLGTNHVTSHYYQGLMDDFALFGSTFTDAQVLSHYNCER